MDNFKDIWVKKNTVTKQLPKYSRTTEEIIPFSLARGRRTERFIRKVKKIFEGAAEQTLFYHGPDWSFYKTSFEERNDIYSRSYWLGERITRQSIEKKWMETGRSRLYIMSCTGIMIPSLDAYLINKLKLRQDIVRLL
jgi:predicted naringenin-chalcone synthase